MNCANWQKLRNKEFCLNAETPHENIGAQVREFSAADKGQQVESISADPAERDAKIKIGANKKGIHDGDPILDEVKVVLQGTVDGSLLPVGTKAQCHPLRTNVLTALSRYHLNDVRNVPLVRCAAHARAVHHKPQKKKRRT